MKQILITTLTLTMVVYCSTAPAPRGDLMPARTEWKPFTWEGKLYTVKWNESGKPDSQGGFLTITHKPTGNVVASTLPGRAFITAGFGQETVEESRGSFFIDENRSRECSDQIIESVEQKPGQLLLRGSVICDDDKRGGYQALFYEQEGRLDADIRLFSQDLNRVYLTLQSSEEETFVGFGEQFSYFNMKGKRLPIFVMEQGIGRGAEPITTGANIQANAGGDWHTSYAGVPHFITNTLKSFFLKNTEYSVFDMREDESLTIEVFSKEMQASFIGGKDVPSLVETYTNYSGRMRKLPEWSYKSAVIGMQGGTQIVREKLQMLEKANTPISAFWLQDWCGQRKTSFGKQLWWNWELDKDRYPNWNEFNADLKRKDIKMMTYINPFLADLGDLKPNIRRNLFEEAKEKGYLIKNPEGEPYLILNTDFYAGLIDLTNPAARKWIKSVIKEELINTGSDGWMADFGEALPYDAVLYSGESPVTYHNKYPVEWAKVNREAIQEAGRGNDIVFFSRSGFTQSPKYTTLFWLGDQLVSWDEHDGIKTAVTGLLSSGLSGYAYNHSDIGGYTTITNPIADYHRSKELFQRWAELSAFNVVFRTHEGNQPDNNHQFYSDEETVQHFAKMARLFESWFSYRKKLVAEAARTGAPVVRPLFYHYPDDARALAIEHEQFMVGEDMIVRPVLDEGQNSVSAYLPEAGATWIHIWSGKEFSGKSEAVVEAPIGKPAVFVRSTNRKLLDSLKKAK